jgi:hypothetical protein
MNETLVIVANFFSHDTTSCYWKKTLLINDLFGKNIKSGTAHLSNLSMTRNGFFVIQPFVSLG